MIVASGRIKVVPFFFSSSMLGLPVEDEELIPANLEHGSLHSHIYHLRTAYVDFTENVTEGQPLPASPERYV